MLASRVSTWPRDHFCRSTIAPRLSRPTTWKEFLPISMPITAIGVTEVVNLGDHVSGPLEPRRTADLLIERGFPSIRGDQDRRLVELDLASRGASERIDYKQLGRNHLDWLAGLQPTMVYRDE